MVFGKHSKCRILSSKNRITSAGKTGLTNLVASAVVYENGTAQVTRQVSTVINGILIDSIEDCVHVCTALSVASIRKLLGRVDRDDHDGCQNGDDTDHEKEFNEGEPFPCSKSRETHKKEGEKMKEGQKAVLQIGSQYNNISARYFFLS